MKKTEGIIKTLEGIVPVVDQISPINGCSFIMTRFSDRPRPAQMDLFDSLSEPLSGKKHVSTENIRFPDGVSVADRRLIFSAEKSAIFSRKLKDLSSSRFRAGFHLRKKDLEYIHDKGITTIVMHAMDFIRDRLSPAFIANDGKQTPMKSHPVFIGQHATGTCCRSCLKKWHAIEPGKELNQNEQDYIVGLILAWIAKELLR